MGAPSIIAPNKQGNLAAWRLFTDYWAKATGGGEDAIGEEEGATGGVGETTGEAGDIGEDSGFFHNDKALEALYGPHSPPASLPSLKHLADGEAELKKPPTISGSVSV